MNFDVKSPPPASKRGNTHGAREGNLDQEIREKKSNHNNLMFATRNTPVSEPLVVKTTKNTLARVCVCAVAVAECSSFDRSTNHHRTPL